MPFNTEKEVREEILSEGNVKERDNWAKTFMAFLKVVEKKHPNIWEDMKEVTGSNVKLTL